MESDKNINNPRDFYEEVIQKLDFFSKKPVNFVVHLFSDQ